MTSIKVPGAVLQKEETKVNRANRVLAPDG